VEPLAAGVVEPAHRERFEQQGAVDQAAVDPQQQLRIEGVVGKPGHRVDSVDPGVDLVDPVGRRVRLGLRPECDRIGQHQRALEPLPGVPLVEAGLPRAGDDQRVRGLHQDRASAAKEHRHLPMDLPGDAVGPEVAGIPGHAPTVRSLRDG
jgi:hypothetical protein